MRRLWVLMTAIAISVGAYAQQEVALVESSDSDLQGRFKVALDIPIGEKVSLSWSEQVRVKDSFGSMDKLLTSLTVGYTPFFSVTKAYSVPNCKNFQGV